MTKEQYKTILLRLCSYATNKADEYYFLGKDNESEEWRKLFENTFKLQLMIK